ncbi:MAG: hypothetical protein P9F75_03780 [Candidatus Contendobacter sp.]|nr:hypothetical protein [Candidatus Contendobacter sp.]
MRPAHSGNWATRRKIATGDPGALAEAPGRPYWIPTPRHADATNSLAADVEWADHPGAGSAPPPGAAPDLPPRGSEPTGGDDRTPGISP